MSEQRPSQQWIVKVNGVEEVRLDPGESLEIGRKPLRPLADDGRRRLDVPDETRSMSKRHALFAVSEDGAATMRDLRSTNGTYVVGSDGALMRVPDDADFLLPGSPVRFQFGDVPVDCVRVETDVPDERADVPDLFSYAAPTAASQQEPDAADMSVDDILDLRAGEPTGAFDAGSVRSRIGAIHAQALAGVVANADASQQHAAAVVPGAAPGVDPVAGASVPPSASAATTAGTSASATTPTAAGSPRRDLFADAIGSVKAADPGAPGTPAASFGAGTPASDAVSGLGFGAVAASSASSASEPQRDDDARFRPQTGVAQSDVAQTNSASTAAAAQSGAATAGTFEPGSVFDRVTRGEFLASRPVIEAGGHTSDEAKTSRDFAAQFEMARYAQLLPFLAMNPALYDDLYAWLSAQGSHDIDAALEKNDGYHDYLKAMGK